MRVFLTFLLLFVLTIGLLIGIDLVQGARAVDFLGDIDVSRTELTGEDYVLIFFFTVPFGVAKIALNYMDAQKKKRNQEQNEGQNTAK